MSKLVKLSGLQISRYSPTKLLTSRRELGSRNNGVIGSLEWVRGKGPTTSPLQDPESLRELNQYQTGFLLPAGFSFFHFSHPPPPCRPPRPSTTRRLTHKHFCCGQRRNGAIITKSTSIYRDDFGTVWLERGYFFCKYNSAARFPISFTLSSRETPFALPCHSSTAHPAASQGLPHLSQRCVDVAGASFAL